MSTQSILLDNPKGDNQSWEDWGNQLAEKYKTPADTPGLPLVPGTTSIPATWSEYGDQWKDWYDALTAAPPIQTPKSTGDAPVLALPSYPAPGSSGDAWAAWGSSIGQAYAEYGKAIGKKYDAELVAPQTPTDGNWTQYGNQWAEYGKKLAEKAKQTHA